MGVAQQAADARVPCSCETSDIVQIRLLGRFSVSLRDREIALPHSRKIRGLIAILSVARSPVQRSDLCDLLWDGARDPRRELRWCLSKIRSSIASNRTLFCCEGPWLSIDRTAAFVDLDQFRHLAKSALASGGVDALARADASMTGLFMADIEPFATPRFENWLERHRSEVSILHLSVLKALADELPCGSPARNDVLRRVIDQSPYEDDAHVALIESLAKARLLNDARRHLQNTLKIYREEQIETEKLEEMRSRIAELPPSVAASVRSRPPRNVGSFSARGDAVSSAARARPIIAVMPSLASGRASEPFARNLARDVAVGLATQRLFHVISPDTVLMLIGRGLGHRTIGSNVSADYICSIELEERRSRLDIRLQLARNRDHRLVWAQVFSVHERAVHEASAEIGPLIVSALAGELERSECAIATSDPASCASAWASHHRGLWHLHRFKSEDNEIALGHFDQAVKLDPSFSRCHAAKSYAHWMNAFAFHPEDRSNELSRAFDAAAQGLHSDPRDPGSQWSMARVLWMSGDASEAKSLIDRAIEHSPSYALAHHARSFAECLSGDAKLAIAESDLAARLSPFDPWRYAMHGVQAVSNLRLGNLDAAATAARSLTSSPNAHVQARGLAVLILAACGKLADASKELRTVRTLRASYGLSDFLGAYHLKEPLRRTLVKAGRSLGMQKSEA